MATNNAVNTSLSGQTGTGSFVGSNSPALVTPNIGVAAGTSFNTITGVASQADQETATSIVTAVTPGRQKYHPSAAKAWVQHDGTGVIAGSYNITSVIKNSTGDYTVTLTVPFSNENYSISSQAQSVGLYGYKDTGTFTASAIQLTNVVSNTAALIDVVFGCIHFFGDQ